MVRLQRPNLDEPLSTQKVADFLGVSVPRVHQLERALRGQARGRGGPMWTLQKVLDHADQRIASIERFIESGVDARIAVSSQHHRIIGMNTAAERMLYCSRHDVRGFDLGTFPELPKSGQQGVTVVFQRGSWRHPRQPVVTIEPSSPSWVSSGAADVPDWLRVEAERLCAETRQQRGLERKPEEEEGTDWTIRVAERDYPELGGGDVNVWVRRRDVGGAGAFSVFDLNPEPLEAELSKVLVQIELSDPTDTSGHFSRAMRKLARDLATHCMAESCAIFIHRLPTGERKSQACREDSQRTAADPLTQTVVAHGAYGAPDELVEQETFVLIEKTPGVVAEAMQSRLPIQLNWPQAEDEQLQRVRLPNYANIKLNSRFRRVGNALVVPIHLAREPSDASGLLFGAIRLVNFFAPSAGESRFELLPAVPGSTTRAIQTVAQHVALLYRRVLRGAQLEAILRTLESVRRWDNVKDHAGYVVRDLQELLEFEQVVIWRYVESGPFELVAAEPREHLVRDGDAPARWSPPQAAMNAMETVPFTRKEGPLGEPISGFEVPIRSALAAGRARFSLGLYNSWLLNEAHASTERELERLAESVAIAIGARIPPEGD